MTLRTVHHLSAFSEVPSGGNPAGVWVGEELPAAEAMQQIAAEVGYSETAFLAPSSGVERTIRYYSPLAEVSFCGHATIASGVLLGQLEGPGTYLLQSSVGPVAVEVRQNGDRIEAALTSVATRQRSAESVLPGALAALGWDSTDLDSSIPPVIAYAGAWHLVMAVRERATLDALNYDFDRLLGVMQTSDLTTLQLVWREAEDRFHARNPFPIGGVVEDPATGAAAAALGGYLRDSGLLVAPAEFEIHQGLAMGRPSLLRVAVPEEGGIVVSGTGVTLEAGAEG